VISVLIRGECHKMAVFAHVIARKGHFYAGISLFALPQISMTVFAGLTALPGKGGGLLQRQNRQPLTLFAFLCGRDACTVSVDGLPDVVLYFSLRSLVHAVPSFFFVSLAASFAAAFRFRTASLSSGGYTRSR
jgi:hypothetical protein